MKAALVTLLLVAGCAAAPREPGDAPESRHAVSGYVAPASHAAALASWKRAEDVNAFIGSRFEYDRGRAMLLSETQRAGSKPAIHAPGEFFASPRGVCVDLSRFAVETLRAVDPGSKPMFLMIEFEPVTIARNTLRLHWLASYHRDGQHWFFGDSKRPGHIAGPYPTMEAFIADYEGYRGRRIVRWRSLASFERTVRTRAERQDRSPTSAPQ